MQLMNMSVRLRRSREKDEEMIIKLHLYIPIEGSSGTCRFAEYVEKTPQTPWR
jgi:hypothetical protein